MPSPIALLTDFGLADPYVGQMKGALLRHAPQALLVDLCHQVLPYNILQAGFLLAASRAHFPQRTIFTAVVDPGVGTTRRIVLVEAFGQFFLAPDNGLLTQLLLDAPDAVARDVTPLEHHGGGATVTGRKGTSAGLAGPVGRVLAGSGRDVPAAGRNGRSVALQECNDPDVGRTGASATFHGRDVFAPLAARLANGEDPAALGDPVDPGGLVRLPEARPVLAGDALTASVLHVDRFGNCLLNLEIRAWAERLAEVGGLRLRASEGPAAVTPLRVAASYAQLASGQVGLIAGSQGVLELALNQASAAAVLGLSPGGRVTIILAGLLPQ